MNNELANIGQTIVMLDAELSLLADKIVQEIEVGKRALAISISETISMRKFYLMFPIFQTSDKLIMKINDYHKKLKKLRRVPQFFFAP